MAFDAGMFLGIEDLRAARAALIGRPLPRLAMVLRPARWLPICVLPTCGREAAVDKPSFRLIASVAQVG